MPDQMPPSTAPRTPDESERPASGTQYLDWGSLLTMGLVTGVAVALGVLLGLLVDKLAGTAPTFLFVGLVVGVLVAVAYLVNKIRSYLPSRPH